MQRFVRSQTSPSFPDMDYSGSEIHTLVAEFSTSLPEELGPAEMFEYLKIPSVYVANVKNDTSQSAANADQGERIHQNGPSLIEPRFTNLSNPVESQLGSHIRLSPHSSTAWPMTVPGERESRLERNDGPDVSNQGHTILEAGPLLPRSFGGENSTIVSVKRSQMKIENDSRTQQYSTSQGRK
jgi:hypothetical protein